MFVHLLCNSYFDDLMKDFSNPKTASMLGIMNLHDEIMFYILIVFILKIFFFVAAILQSYNFNIHLSLTKFLFKRKTDGNDFIYKIFKRRLILKIDEYIFSKIYNFYHLPSLEFIWTLIPAIILVLMGVPSIYLLYSLEVNSKPIFNIMITGNQWYWTYQYSDYDLYVAFSDIVVGSIISELSKNYNLIIDDNVDFLFEVTKNHSFMYAKKNIERFLILDSLILVDDSLPEGYPRLLSVDNPLIIPTNSNIRFLITSNDVIHSWAIPSFGIKMDAIPGRLNQVIIKTPFSGTTWGQCSELCGVNHGYMPIEIRALNMVEFEKIIELYIKKILNNHFKSYYKFVFPKIFNLLKDTQFLKK